MQAGQKCAFIAIVFRQNRMCSLVVLQLETPDHFAAVRSNWSTAANRNAWLRRKYPKRPAAIKWLKRGVKAPFPVS
jgi:hypothetical protein